MSPLKMAAMTASISTELIILPLRLSSEACAAILTA
jgi:hypothetical protein